MNTKQLKLPVIHLKETKPVKLLVDTCVWIDLAKDQSGRSLLQPLEELVRLKEVRLIVPQTVLDEMARNRPRVIKENLQSVASALKRAREAMEIFVDRKFKRVVGRELIEVERRLGDAGDEAASSLARVEKLLVAGETVPTTDAIKLRASQRAIERKAPFHGQRNSINDAILIETYADLIEERVAGQRYGFVTHNHNDFSQERASRELPHSDIAILFSKIRSRYFISLAEALRSAHPWALRDLLAEQAWSEFPPRRLSEIVGAENEFFDKVWYNRHTVRREKIEAGKIRIVEKETIERGARRERTIQHDIWRSALRAAEGVRKRRGLQNLGPWDTFEWGMVNGKLSAIRWVLGDEWDMLDT